MRASMRACKELRLARSGQMHVCKRIQGRDLAPWLPSASERRAFVALAYFPDFCVSVYAALPRSGTARRRRGMLGPDLQITETCRWRFAAPRPTQGLMTRTWSA